ncbi:DHA2 family efflux MFS transporter permease subunit [Teichococcus aestuarii]|uniref:DHA2 family efflux MFS transporter permease subunit n=1 Tax=Teichococcus aestuarii TaxID=568898 RepID=UPI003609C16F
MVIIGLTATLAPTIGPTLGGWLTQAFSWHWLFLINVPIGAAIALVVWNTVYIDRPDPSLLARFDWWGLLFMALFLGSLEYVMEEGPRWDWLADEMVRNLAFLCAVSGVLFFWRALSREEPIVDLRAFTNRNFTLGCILSFTMGIGLYGAVYLIPLFLGRVRGYNSMQIGEVMFITGLCMFLAAPVVGRLLARFDPRIPLAAGLVLFFWSLHQTAQLTAQSAFPELAFPLGLRGVAMMLCMAPINQMALGTIPPAALKGASGLYNLMRNLGGAVGLAAINTLATDRSYLHRLHLSEQVNWAREGCSPTRTRWPAPMRGGWARRRRTWRRWRASRRWWRRRRWCWPTTTRCWPWHSASWPRCRWCCSCAAPARAAAGTPIDGRILLFLKKKKQKTSPVWRPAIRQRHAKPTKVFWFFFQKRTIAF